MLKYRGEVRDLARTARVQSTTGIYHVIVRGLDGENVFRDDIHKNKFLEFLAHYKDICGYHVYGYCFLDNHLHLLIKEGKVKLGNIMKRIGVKYVTWYNNQYNRKGGLFYDRFKSEVVESDAYLLKVLRYIHQEPVKLGLVTEVSRYAYSSYGKYVEKEPESLIDYDTCLGLLDGTKAKQMIVFTKFMNEPSNEMCLEAEREVMSDADLLLMILRLAEVKTVEELKALPKLKRNEVLHEVKAVCNASFNKIVRVTGFGMSIVARA